MKEKIEKYLYSKKFKKIAFKVVSILFFIVILLIIINLIFIFFKEFKDQKFSNTFFGVLWGSLFTSFFVLIGYMVNKYMTRHRKNQNALVRLECILTNNLNEIKDNETFLNGFIKSIKDKVFYFTEFNKLEINKEIIIDLYDIDLINKIFVLNINTKRINNSFCVLFDSYKEAKEYFLDKKITKEEFGKNSEGLLEKLIELKKGLNNFQDSIIEVLATIRVLEKNNLLIDRLLINFLRSQFYDKRFEKKVKIEINEIKEEIKIVEKN